MTYLILGGATAVLVGLGLWGTRRGPIPEGMAVILLIASVAPALALVVTGIDRATCSQHSERLGMATEYRALSGCYVRTGDGMVPYDRWVDVTRGGGR